MTERMSGKIKIGVSSCLLGNEVRFDGGHKRDRYLTDTLAHYFDYLAVCPEVECGLPVPRESMRLVGEVEKPRLVATKSGTDHTDRMENWAQKRVTELEKEKLCGFIFKSKSPSSGMERVKVYDKNSIPQSNGVGIFARIFKDHFPLLPVEEEGRLHDPLLRENFIEAVFVYVRWQDVIKINKPAALVEFHTKHKYLLHAHNEELYRLMGKITAEAGAESFSNRLEKYQTLLMQTLQTKPTRKKHINILQHLMGYFKNDLAGDEKAELLEIIDQYRDGNVPLIVPVTILNHYVRKYKQKYLQNQIYLKPHPIELRLRNHA